MHRADREVKDISKTIEFLNEEKVCRIGLYDGEKVYVVPMNYGFEHNEGRKLTFYLHCAQIGRRIDIVKKNPEVCIEIDGRHMLETADIPCDYGYFYMSLIGNGRLKFVDDIKEKEDILCKFMLQQTGKEINNFGEKWLNAVCIMKLELTDYTVKEHKKQ